MKSQGSYVPPRYIPLEQSDIEVVTAMQNEDPPVSNHRGDGMTQWSSGICACCDDMQSCSGTLVGSCATHCILWAIVNTVCCMMTDGILLGLPGCFVACYACGYRRALRAKYNLEEAPCGDLVTHFCCHLCAICQEYREIRERSDDSNHPDLKLAVVAAPQVQIME